MTTERVLVLIAAERDRQDALVDEGKLPWNCASPGVSLGGQIMVLGEEFGEVSQAAFDCHVANKPTVHQVNHLRTELIHLGAVAVAMVESLENL